MPLQPAYLDVPLTGTKQANDPRTAPLDGAYLLENYQIERGGAARKRFGFVSNGGISASRIYPQSGTSVRYELADGTYKVGLASSTTASTVGLGGVGGLGKPLMPSQSLLTLVQQSIPTTLTTDCGSYAVQTLDYVVVVTQEFTTTPVIKIAVYSLGGTPLLPSMTIPTFSSASTAPIPFSACSGSSSSNDFAVAYSDAGGTKVIGVRIGTGSGGLDVSTLHTTTVSAATLEDLCRGPGGTCIVITLSTTNAVLSMRSVATGTQTATLNLPSASGNATSAAINVGNNLSRAAALVSGTFGSSNTSATLLNLTPSSMTVTGAVPTTLPNPTSRLHMSTVIVNEIASGAQTSHVAFFANSLATIGTGGTTGPVVTAVQIAANGSIIISPTLYVGYQLAAKGWSPTQDQCAQPLVCVDLHATGSAGASAVAATAQTYGYGVVIADPCHEGTGNLVSTRPLYSVRSWHGPGRALRYTTIPRLGNYTYEASPLGHTVGFTVFDRASTAGVESSRALVVRLPGVAGAQTAATGRPVSSAAQVSPATTLLGAGALMAMHGVDTRPAADLHPADILSLARIAGSGSWGGGVTSIAVRGRYIWLDSSGAELTSAWSLPAQIAVDSTIEAVDIEVRVPQYLPSCCGTRPQVQLAVATATSKGFSKGLIEPAPLFPLASSVPVIFSGGVQKVRLTSAGVTSASVDTSELSNVMPPTARYVSIGRQRAFLVSAEDNRVYFSKPLTQGVLPEWALELTLEPPPAIGSAVACEELGDKIVVIGTQGVCYYVGDGPDALGDGSPYAGPYEALSGQGCSSGMSVVKSPDALFFRSSHTIVAINAGMQPSLLGREVFDTLNANPLTLARGYYQKGNLVLWLVSPGNGFASALYVVYNVSTASFSTWGSDPGELQFSDFAANTNLSAIGTGFTLVYTDPTGASTATGFDATLVPVLGKLVTPYIRLEQVQKFQRLWHVQCQVDVKAAGNTLSLTIYRDGLPTGTLIGAKTFATAGVQPVDFHVPANLQRCSSVRLEFADGQASPVSSTVTCGVDILGITLEIGVKRGLRAVPSAQRA